MNALKGLAVLTVLALCVVLLVLFSAPLWAPCEYLLWMPSAQVPGRCFAKG